AIPIGMYFDLEHEHKYLFLDGHEYSIGPKFLVTLPENLMSAITFPDFSQVFSMTSIKYIIMFALVGSLESLLSAKAIDGLDPFRRKSNMNKDLVGVGIGNVLAGLIGGLAMISEIVRSSSNINNGAKTAWSNFFHGAFLLIFVAFFPLLIHQIPLAALAALLVYTGYKLASLMAFVHTYKIGKEQLFIFLLTIIVTLATDLLLGIAAGILLKIIIHLTNGLPLKYLFKPLFTVTVDQEKETYIVDVFHSAVFSNYIKLKNSLDALPKGKTINVDFSNSNLVDHTVMENLHHYQHDYEHNGGQFSLTGMSHLQKKSDHHLSSRKKQKVAI
uniref:SulP family inorganic anion transporter n=1 Tax=Aquiflexum sp. TaxID=1872584 RepID=UPI003593F123